MSSNVSPANALKLHAEHLQVQTEQVLTGRVSVSTTTHTREQLVDELLVDQDVRVEHVACGVFVNEMPQIRQEGETTVIPIVEEVLVTEKRLFLKEEIHVHRVRIERRHQETVLLREERATIQHEIPDHDTSTL